MDKARETAVRILYEVHENGAYANVALAKALRQMDLGEQDRRAHIDAVRREDASRARDRDAPTGQVDGEGASLPRGGRRRGEVVLVLAHRP